LVSGPLGGSRLGKQFDFTPRVALSLELHEQFELHAGMDISDGLSLDLWRVCQASGCGAVLDADAVPISAAAREMSQREPVGPSARERALSDGEDFELLLAAPASAAQRMVAEHSLIRVGEFVAEPGLWLRDERSVLSPLTPRGFEHGA
jgi:thiamine-monophosphate kinase